MKIGKVNKHTVEMYDSIDEMPIQRFQKYNKYLLVDSGIGTDLQDIINHINRAKIYAVKDPKLAVAELDNMSQALYLVSEELSPKYMAFAVLVYKIDGKVMDDLTDLGLKRVLDILKEAKKGWLDGVLNSVKKKIDAELSLYFPGRFRDGISTEYYNEVREHTLLRLDRIITGAEVTEACNEIENRLAMLVRPRIFSGPKSQEIAYDKQFEDMCLVLANNLQIDPYKMTVMQFYNAFDYLKKLAKQKRAK